MSDQTPNIPNVPSSSSSSTAKTTLGGVQKATFKPTVPARRNKKETSKPITSLLADTRPRFDRGRGRGGAKMGRGRGRGRGREIQQVASGPFSMGPATAPGGRPTMGGGHIISMPGFHGECLPGVKLEEQVEMYDMNDYFQHSSDSWAPLVLPRQDDNIKKESRNKKSIKSEDGVRIKTEGSDLMENEEDMFEDADEDEKKKPFTRDDAKEEDFTNCVDMNMEPEDDKRVNNGEKFLHTEDGMEDRLFLFQFPSIFPKLKQLETPVAAPAVIEEDQVVIKTEPGVTSISTPTPSPTESEKLEKKESKGVEGYFGKLIVYRSGKMKMKFGDILMDVRGGSDASFLQTVVAVDQDGKSAFLLGNVSDKQICSPDLEYMLERLAVQEENQLQDTTPSEVMA